MTKDKAKDEPIAWMYLEPENKFGLVHVDEYDYKQFPVEDEWIPVYKHPQPERTWVGLTNDELTDLFYNTNLGQMSAVGQAIELLKERNS